MAGFDVVVCGLGAMGSAALHTSSRAGARACSGSTASRPAMTAAPRTAGTRIIRLGYFEHPSYVPLLRRAYALWRELEAASGRELLHVTGIAEIGPPDGELVAGTLASSRLHGLAHEMLAAAELMRRFPAFRLPADYVAVMQPDGGFLEAEPAIDAQLALAAAAGAQIRRGETVRAIEPRSGSACASSPMAALSTPAPPSSLPARGRQSLLPQLAAARDARR